MTEPTDDPSQLRERIRWLERRLDRVARQRGGLKDALRRMTASRDCLREALVGIQRDTAVIAVGTRQALNEARRHAK